MVNRNNLQMMAFPREIHCGPKDGTKVGFERHIDNSIALDNLIVVDPETGKELADISVCPASSGEMNIIRYIEGIEWLTEDKISAKGSVNPSTTQAFVYDIEDWERN